MENMTKDSAFAREAVCVATDNVIARSGLSGYELARLSGLTNASISRYRSGLVEPSSMAILKMELAMDEPRGIIYAEAAKFLNLSLAS